VEFFKSKGIELIKSCKIGKEIKENLEGAKTNGIS